MTDRFIDNGAGLPVSWWTPPQGWVDALLGGTLCGPRWLTLLLLVVTTYGIVALIRRLTIPRQCWEQLLADERRLKQRLRRSRQAGDREAIARYRHIRRRVAQAKLRTEFPAHLLCILATWSLLAWASANLRYHSIAPGKPLDVSIEFPVSRIDHLIRLAPGHDIDIEDGPIRIIEVDGTGPATRGFAEWTIRVREDADGEIPLHFRSRDAHWVHRVSGDRCRSPEVRIIHNDGILTRLNVPQFDPFFIEGILPESIPPWSVAYFALLIPGLIRVTWLQNSCASQDL